MFIATSIENIENLCLQYMETILSKSHIYSLSRVIEMRPHGKGQGWQGKPKYWLILNFK